MPSPALYVFAVVAGVAAGYAFKEFVYEPHIAPKLEEWAEAYTAYRKEQRRRRAHPHESYSDYQRGGGGGQGPKSSFKLENAVDREMQNLDRGGELRQRNNQRSKDNAVEMLEKPNAFILFEPLSPERAHSVSPPPSNPFSSHRETALPIGRLPTPVSDRQTASPQLRPATPNSVEPSQFQATHSSPENASLSLSSEFESAFLGSALGSRAPSRMTSEYDFVPGASADAGVGGPNLRSMTPSTDARSEASLDFMGSDAMSSDAELLYVVDSDAESFSSHAGSEASAIHRNADFLRVPSVEVRSDTGSDDWERVSDMGR